MAEASDRQRELIDAALRIYRPAMRRCITDTLSEALGDDWYEEWLEQRLDPQRDQPQLPKGARSRYVDNQRRVRELKLDPFWLIDVRDFADIINTCEGDFPPEIRDQTGTMRKIDTIAKSSESRASQQVDRILENCNTVLQAVGGDAAKQIQRLIETGEPEKPWKAEVGSLQGGLDSKKVIRDVIEDYLYAMRDYMGDALHRGHASRTGSYNWFQELVLPNWPEYMRRMAKEKLPNTSPKEVIDVGNIADTIRDNPQDFPEELSDGTYEDLFNLINQARRDFLGHPTRSKRGRKRGAERVAGACVTILTLCERDSALEAIGEAMDEINRFFGGDSEPQRAGFVLNQLASLGSDIWVRGKRFLLGLRRRGQEGRTLRGEAADPGSTGEVVQSGSASGGGESSATTQILIPPPFQQGVGGDGGLGATTQEGMDDGGHAPPAREDDGQRVPSRRWLLAAIAAVIAIPIAAYFVYSSWFSADALPELNPPGSETEAVQTVPEPPPEQAEQEPEEVNPPPSSLAGLVIDDLTCEPEMPEVGEAITCSASLSGGEPDSWWWSGGGDPPSGDASTFTTKFISAGDREISLTVGNSTGSASRSLAFEVASAPSPSGGISLSSGAGHSCRLTDDGAAACWGRNGQGQRDVLDGRFTAISAGSAHTCGLRESGAVVCWGWGEHNQLNWPSDKKFVSISAGHRHTCGITEQRDVVCWGSDEDGHDGQFSQVSAGYSHNCAITTSGEVECWGSNSKGQLDAFDGRFTAISAGQDHTCGLRHGGGVECWGGGEASESPEGSFRAISAGQFHNCGILTSGAVRCWGDDGDDNKKGRLDAPDGGDFAQIDAGAEHTCAVRSNGEIECWGNTPHGLDDPDSADIGDHGWQGNDPPPGPAAGPAPQSTTGEDETPEIAGTFRAISAGHEHTCGLRNDGTITCWGEDSLGRTDTPAGKFSAVSAGTFHTCGLRDNGTIECWGSDSDGQSKAPTGRFSAVSAGTLHTCGLHDNGTIECWGSNSDGQRKAPTGRFSAVSAGTFHTCGLHDDGAIECWEPPRSEWNNVPEGKFDAVSAGTLYTCGLRTNGAIECWGNPRSERNNVPEGKFDAVSAGYGHACGLRDDGAIRCWGDNEKGQSGAPEGRFSAVSAGSRHTCGLRDNGTIECWGDNEKGQINGPTN